MELGQSLVGDPTRQAIDSLEGYDYQIVRTVETWLQLSADEKIYIECAEDYDVVGPCGAIATQVKNSPSTITLNSGDVRDAVRNYWVLRERNSGRDRISLRFLTRGRVGKEQKSKLGSETGIELWRKAASGDDAAARLVADHLIEQGGSDSFIDFLRDVDGADLCEKLFSRIEWVTEEHSIEAARLVVSRLAVKMGSRENIPPIVAERAVPALLDHCRQVATKKDAELRSLTLADAKIVFARHTSLSVPITERLAVTMGMMAAASCGGLADMTFAPVFDGELPELPTEHLPRKEFVAALTRRARESGCVLIVGSESEGKSTAANMVARLLDPAAYWMDLRGGDEQVSAAAIENAILVVRGARPPSCVALDDVPAAQGVSDALWGRLRALIDSCRRSKATLVMTSKGVPANAVDPKFRSASVAVALVPRIGEEELIDYLRSLGCADPQVALSWARMMLAHTGGGHPKLVYLAALELRDRGWKVADAAEFVATPRSVEEARTIARQTATRTVPQPDRGLLFALSLTTVAFERGVALELGRRLYISEPGAALDRLAGRWIELLGRTGYKATTLLNGQAKELWSPERVRQTHVLLLDSFMATKSIRLDQAMGLFLHAFQSQDAPRFIKFVLTIVSHIERTEGLAEALELVVYFGSIDGQPAIAFDENASTLFRYLQFRVARARHPELLPEIARRWLWEIERLAQPAHRNFTRALRGMAIAMASEGSFSAATVVEAVQDAALLETLGIDTLTITAADLEIPSADSQGVIDPMHLLFMVAQANFGSAHGVDDMLAVLATVPADFRRRLLGGFDLPLAREGFSMFDRALIAETKASQANWQGLSNALVRSAKAGREWGAAGFADSAARTLSIALSEHIGDQKAACLVLQEAAAAGTSPVIMEQMANLAFRRGEHDQAVRLWDKSLHGSDQAGEQGVRDPFAMRFAAIACARLRRFDEAALWLERAAALSEASFKLMPAALFRSDAGYCWFRHGDAKRMLRATEEARREVSTWVDPEAHPRLFAAQKFLGHTLAWMRNEVIEPINNFSEPIVGAASDPNLDVAAIGLEPATAPDMLALLVVELCVLLGINEPWLPSAVSTVEASTDPYIVIRYRAARLRALLSQGDYLQVASEVHELHEAFLCISLVVRRMKADLPADPTEKPDSALRESKRDLPAYCFALTLSLATMNKVDRHQLLQAWRASLASAANGVFIAGIADEVALAFEVSGAEAMDRVRKAQSRVERIGAASSVLAADASAPRDTAQAQWVLAYNLLVHSGRQVLRAGTSALANTFRRQWERHLACRALLVTPRLTVPLLQQAISAQEPPTRKILSLAVAGAQACGDHVPDFILAVLNEAAISEGPREGKAQDLAATAIAVTTPTA
ncbi:tetratricopeptide repeat protein [Candidatus Propionivibrio aalborgensis]|nr:tetratricopeptide repeat protein [Candidatus Propionivibrio aalborgensis]